MWLPVRRKMPMPLRDTRTCAMYFHDFKGAGGEEAGAQVSRNLNPQVQIPPCAPTFSESVRTSEASKPGTTLEDAAPAKRI